MVPGVSSATRTQLESTAPLIGQWPETAFWEVATKREPTEALRRVPGFRAHHDRRATVIASGGALRERLSAQRGEVCRGEKLARVGLGLYSGQRIGGSYDPMT
jgi:hypothetical protein